MTKTYHTALDLTADTSQTRILRLVGSGKRVLEFGCATGYMTRVLTRELGCTVTGIEVDPEAARAAEAVAHRVIVGDVETLDYAKELGEARFDVVIFADVLEHLKDPAGLLRQIRPFVTPEGVVLASIPNVAHAAVALDLLQGRFTYRPLGLLDDTHLRFFTRRTIVDLFESAGYVVSQLDRLRAELDATELRVRAADLPEAVVKVALQHEEATTYQFIVTAVPATEPRNLQELVETRAALEKSREAITDREAVIAAREAVIAAREAEIDGAREIIHAKDAEIDRAREIIHAKDAEIDRAREIIHAKDAELHGLRRFVAETPRAWAKVGLRLFLPPGPYEKGKRLYRRLRGLPHTGTLGLRAAPRGELPAINGRPLLDLLACSACGHAPLADGPAGLACPRCGAAVPLAHGAPVFLERPGDYVDRTAQTARTNPYSAASLDIIRRHPGGIVLDLGAGHPRDEELFPNVLRQEVIHFASTHVVSTTPRLPFRDGVFDAVVCESVLEHVADPWRVAEEIYRVLEPGGVIRVDSAFLQPFHGDPSHYFNMTVPGIERVFRRFRKLRSGVDAHQAPSFSIRMLLQQYRDLIRDPQMKARIEQFLALPFEQTDRELTPTQHNVVGAGVFFEGMKDAAGS